MAKWKRTGKYSYTPNFEMTCRGCRDSLSKMVMRGVKLLRHPLDVVEQKVFESHAQDYAFFCNLCGYRELYGIPISKEEFEVLYAKAKEKKCSSSI